MHKTQAQIPTREQVLGVLEVTLAVGQAIRELGRVPSGELYARLMPTGIKLESYNAIINALVRAKVVKNDNHLLVWVGPVDVKGVTK